MKCKFNKSPSKHIHIIGSARSTTINLSKLYTAQVYQQSKPGFTVDVKLYNLGCRESDSIGVKYAARCYDSIFILIAIPISINQTNYMKNAKKNIPTTLQFCTFHEQKII